MTTMTKLALGNRQQIVDYLLSFDLFKGNEYEGYIYANEALMRFLHTVRMVPPAPEQGGQLLELGANPYFITLLLKYFHRYELTLANYFGQGETHPEGSQTIRSALTGEAHTFRYQHFNVEHDDFPYADDSFDGVLFCEILEHLTLNPTHTLNEIHRVLKPGGFVIVTTPNLLRWQHVRDLLGGRTINDPYSGHGVYGRHNREYTPDEVVRLLKDCGFDVQQLRLANIHHRTAAQYLASGLRAHWSEHIFALAQARTDVQVTYRYPPWLYRSTVALRRVTSNVITMGKNEELHSGTGWQRLETLNDVGAMMRWTEKYAEAFLRAEGGETTVALVVNPGIDLLGPVMMTLRSGDAVAEMQPTPDMWQLVRLPIPACAPGDEVPLEIEVDALRSPLEQGISDDPRHLGIMVRRMMLQSPPTGPLVLPRESDALLVLGSGWHMDDLDIAAPLPFRWTHRTAEVALRAEGGETAIALVVHPGIDALGPVTVTLRSGDAVAEMQPTPDMWQLVRLPIPTCAPGDEVPLEIEVDALRSPQEQGISDDPRHLGIMVRRMMLQSPPAGARALLSDSDAVLVLGSGWHMDDLDAVAPLPYCWTHRTATVHLQAKGGENRVIAEVNSGLELLGPVTVTLRCGDVVQHFPLHTDTWVTLSLDIPPCAPGDDLTLTIAVDDLRSPRQVGFNDDPRLLGVMVWQVALEEATG